MTNDEMLIRRTAANDKLINNPYVTNVDVKLGNGEMGLNVNKLAIKPKTDIKEQVKFIRFKELVPFKEDELEYVKGLINRFGDFKNVDKNIYNSVSYYKHEDYDLVVSYQALTDLDEDGKPKNDTKIQDWKLIVYKGDRYYLLGLITKADNKNVGFRSYAGYIKKEINADIMVDKAIEFKRIPICTYDKVCLIPIAKDVEEGADGTVKQLDSGLFVPETSKVIGKYGERRVEYDISYEYGVIVSMGAGDFDRNSGIRLPMEHDILDKVILPPNYGSPFFLDDIEYRMVRDMDILCKVDW